jgi:site-specific recombinase XerD
MIKKYGNKNKSKDSFIFRNDKFELDPGRPSIENHRTVKNFINALNQGFSKYAKSLGLDERISTYWARHSFATNAIRQGATIEFVGDALGHADTKTTKGYFSGFEEEAKKDFAQSLMEF